MGSLVYLTITRPNITFAVHVVSQFVAAPAIVHWAVVLRSLRYLYHSITQGVILSLLAVSCSQPTLILIGLETSMIVDPPLIFVPFWWLFDIMEKQETIGGLSFLRQS